jgi:hypothetical protein
VMISSIDLFLSRDWVEGIGPEVEAPRAALVLFDASPPSVPFAVAAGFEVLAPLSPANPEVGAAVVVEDVEGWPDVLAGLPSENITGAAELAEPGAEFAAELLPIVEKREDIAPAVVVVAPEVAVVEAVGAVLALF